MQELIDLYRHNAWANERVFALVQAVDPRLVESSAPGTRDTVKGTLGHLAYAERLYLALIEGQPRQSIGPQDAYVARELGWLRQHLQELSGEYIRIIEQATAASLGRRIELPALPVPVTARDGLLQVLTHSSQHRSQVLSWLSAQGIATPDLDYLLMLADRR